MGVLPSTAAAARRDWKAFATSVPGIVQIGTATRPPTTTYAQEQSFDEADDPTVATDVTADLKEIAREAGA